MIVVNLQGGLGNQMFQYAAGKTLSLYNGCTLKLSIQSLGNNNDSSDNNIFERIYELQIFKNINDEIINNDELNKFKVGSIINKCYKKLGLNYYKVYNEIELNYSSEFLNLTPPVLINGYFQSENYFNTFKREISKCFEISELSLDNKNQLFLQGIMKTEAVSIHIRRGDYLLPIINDIHGLCDISYYLNAIRLIQKKQPNAVLYFFSDDLNWVKNNFDALYPNCIYVEGNTKNNSWKDMYLMSKCKHNIIANSSFSWWSAWLNKNPMKIVIAPQKWYKINSQNYNTTTLLPETWITL